MYRDYAWSVDPTHSSPPLSPGSGSAARPWLRLLWSRCSVLSGSPGLQEWLTRLTQQTHHRHGGCSRCSQSISCAVITSGDRWIIERHKRVKQDMKMIILDIWWFIIWLDRNKIIDTWHVPGPAALFCLLTPPRSRLRHNHSPWSLRSQQPRSIMMRCIN